MGTLEATFERMRITRESSATPPALSIRACGSTNSHKALGIPVLLNPSTVMNIPQKNINKEYETCFLRKEQKIRLEKSHSWGKVTTIVDEKFRF